MPFDFRESTVAACEHHLIRIDGTAHPLAIYQADAEGALNDPQVLENDYVVEFDHPTAGRVKEMGYPVRFSETPAQIVREAPEFGQHTEEVLQELGYSWEEIGAFREQGVV